MNISELKAQIVRCGLTIPLLAKEIGMDKKTLYSRFNQEVAFKQNEISDIAQVLNLTPEQIMFIFFADSVS